MCSQQKNKDYEIIEINNRFCTAKIAIQGGQVLHYQKKNDAEGQSYPSLLWLSEHNSFEPAKAIRGGIPLCFPWFGAHSQHADYPAHGFARNLPWSLVATRYDASLGHLLVLELSDQASTRQFWDYAFRVQIHIHCGCQLSLDLHVMNTDQRSFDFNFAWHSYFTVPDIQAVMIRGLENTPFLDKLTDPQQLLLENNAIQFDREIDRIYPKAAGHYQIIDQTSAISIQASDCPSAVVWNPWIEKARRLADMADDAWKQFVCVECGKLDEPIVVEAGQKRIFKMILNRILS